MIARSAARNLNIKFHEEYVVDMFDENIVGTEKRVRAALSRYSPTEPSLIYLTGYELFCLLEQPDLDRIEHCIKESLDELSEKASQPVIFIAATSKFAEVFKTPLSNIFQHDIAVISPTFKEAKDIVQTIKESESLGFSSTDVLNSLSNGEYYVGNLVDAIAKAEVECHTRQLDGTGTYQCDRKINEDVDEGTRWMDVGGLGDIKAEIIDAIQLSIDYPQLKKAGLRRTGILLYGLPGTGKTLLAKAVATECSLNFINVKGPELLNEYVGQSEDNIRKLFQKARESSPSVIFFDEIDSLAPNRGQAGDSGGVMDRMVSQLLAELDGVGKSEDVFVIGATNRVDLVDHSLLRPGRFDKVLEVALPRDKKDRLAILQALTRKMKLAHDVDINELEKLSKPNMSGADFQGFCSRALQRSFDRCVQMIEANEKNEEDVEIEIRMQDFLAVLE